MTAVSLAEELEQAGIAAITIHGRTCSKDYSMKANWREIRRVVESVRRIPVIGNGDVISPETACAMFSETGCSGVMIGRMALKAPWIIRDINAVLTGDRPPASPSKNEQLDFMRRHFEDMVILYGEHIATLLFRRWIPQYTKALHIDRQTMIQLLQVEQVEVLRKKMNELYRNLSNNFSK